MLRLSKISVTQFKNYSFSIFNFNERVVGICGQNGQGKTNLLDAIYYSCFTRSYFSTTDAINVKFNTDGFRIEALFSDQKVVLINRLGGKKELQLNDVVYEKFSHHIGKFPAVVVSPDDVELITGGSEGRRRFIDTVISQFDEKYLHQLIIYNKVLLQRNSLLKSFAETGKTDFELLDVLDNQLVAPCNYIFDIRKSFMAELVPVALSFYNTIASGNEELVSLGYESQLLKNNIPDLFKQFKQKDLMLQRTNVGIHKDDISILLNGQLFKNVASQGQRKSLLFAIKLAEFELLKAKKGYAPLLLLDDIFEKLDGKRMQQLLYLVCIENGGQVFITDTHKERLENAFVNLGTAYQLVEL